MVEKCSPSFNSVSGIWLSVPAASVLCGSDRILKTESYTTVRYDYFGGYAPENILNNVNINLSYFSDEKFTTIASEITFHAMSVAVTCNK